MKLEHRAPGLIRGLGASRLASRKIRGPSAGLGMTQEAGNRKRTSEQKGVPPFCDFLSLGAGVTPAEGSVKPTAGFTFNRVIYPSRGEVDDLHYLWETSAKERATAPPH